MAAKKKKNVEGMAHILTSLKRNRAASYADIKASADKKGLTVYPIMFGRAKLLLGHVKAGKGKAKAKAAMAAKGPRRGPGRPRKGGDAMQLDGLESMLAVVRNTQRDLGRFRGALEKIQGILADVLGG